MVIGQVMRAVVAGSGAMVVVLVATAGQRPLGDASVHAESRLAFRSLAGESCWQPAAMSDPGSGYVVASDVQSTAEMTGHEELLFVDPDHGESPLQPDYRFQPIDSGLTFLEALTSDWEHLPSDVAVVVISTACRRYDPSEIDALFCEVLVRARPHLRHFHGIQLGHYAASLLRSALWLSADEEEYSRLLAVGSKCGVVPWPPSSA